MGFLRGFDGLLLGVKFAVVVIVIVVPGEAAIGLFSGSLVSLDEFLPSVFNNVRASLMAAMSAKSVRTMSLVGCCALRILGLRLGTGAW